MRLASWLTQRLALRLPCLALPCGPQDGEIELVLEAGDLLYLPPYWWHEVVSVGAPENVSLSTWCGTKEMRSRSVRQGCIISLVARGADALTLPLPLPAPTIHTHAHTARSGGVTVLNSNALDPAGPC